jgi:hypothetical protein
VIEQIWSNLLNFASQFVIPDWGGLIALLPVFMLVLVILIFARVAWMYATIGPTRVRNPRRAPVAPPGLHMPGPTYAPIFGAIGMFFLLLGLVFGGLWIPFGIVVLILALLYWGREALATTTTSPTRPGRSRSSSSTRPPPGVHIPARRSGRSSSRSGWVLFLGLVFAGWILLSAIVFTIITLLGWLNDARKEYRHTSTPTRPATSRTSRAVLAEAAALVDGILLVVASCSPRAGSRRSRRSGEEPADRRLRGSPARRAPGIRRPPPGGITVVAKNVSFDRRRLNAPAGAPFKITFDNEDAGRHTTSTSSTKGAPRSSTARTSRASRRRFTTCRRSRPARTSLNAPFIPP